MIESLDPRLGNVAVVLFEPQDDINIGNTVRASKNFGVTDIRLVRPASGDPHRIGISAPRAQDTINAMRRFDSLDEALADAVLVIATTARGRKGTHVVLEPRQAAHALVESASKGKVVVLFGREDSGLPNEALDRCHHVTTIPTDPDYSSLNLGQAVLLMLWETFRVASEIDDPVAAAAMPTSEFPLAPVAGVERMLLEAERSLELIEFFKSDGREHVLRSMRSVLNRARLDTRELAIWFGVFKEVQGFFKRRLGEDLTDQD